MGLNTKKMKFFYPPSYSTTPISNYCWGNWAYIYDVPNSLESSHPLYYLYSKLHNQLPKNADPNIASSKMNILVENDENYNLSTSLPKHLYSTTEGIQHEYEHDLCSQPLLIFSRSPNYITDIGFRSFYAYYN